MTTDTKPYLLQALHGWCMDSDQMSHVAAWVSEHTRAPMQYVHENEIVLNIDSAVSHNPNIDDEWVNFSAHLNGMAYDIWVPAGHVVSIPARESGEGMSFEAKPYQPESTSTQEQIPQSESEDTESVKPRKGLKLVK